MLLCFACRQQDTTSFKDYNSLAIIPTPAKVLERDGMFTLDRKVKLSADFSNSQQQELVAAALKEIKDITGFKLKIADIYRTDANVKTISFILRQEQPNRESYDLLIDKGGIKITSSGPAGLFYGLQTVLQLIKEYSNEELIQIPAMRIKDQPGMAYRGLMVQEVSEDLRYWQKILKQMAGYKLNTLLINSAILSELDSLHRLRYLSLASKYYVRVIPFITEVNDSTLNNFLNDHNLNHPVIATEANSVPLLNERTSGGQIILGVELEQDNQQHSASPHIFVIAPGELEDHASLEKLLLKNSSAGHVPILGAVLLAPDFTSVRPSNLRYHSIITWSKTTAKMLNKTMSLIEHQDN
jgi:hypothetical protein